jgi:hypothetical protein
VVLVRLTEQEKSMTPDEQKLLADLAAKIAQTPAPERDPDAESFIRSHIGNRPDALYLMTQTVLIQNLALDQARQQIQQLQQQTSSVVPARGGSFLGGSGRPAASGPAPGYGQGYAPAPPPPQYYPPQAPAGGGSSFLRSAATTAAGVAGGMLAFEGISSLFGGLTHGFGGGSSFLGGGQPGETIIENNYYDNPGGHDSREGSAGGDSPMGSRDDSRDYSDTDSDAADSDTGDSDTGDSGSFDDGGGFDDGGSGGGDLV